jgi:hypothetical protein
MSCFDDDFNGADLTLYYQGQQVNKSLTPLQLKTIVKILGISFVPSQPNTYEYLEFGDKTLEQLWQMKGNPLKLEER